MLFLFLVTYYMQLVQSIAHMTSNTYRLMKANNGSNVCAINPPSTVIPVKSSSWMTRCAVECTIDPICQLYQFKKDSITSTCELFNGDSLALTVVPGCTIFATISSKHMALIIPNRCTFFELKITDLRLIRPETIE